MASWHGEYFVTYLKKISFFSFLRTRNHHHKYNNYDTHTERERVNHVDKTLVDTKVKNIQHTQIMRTQDLIFSGTDASPPSFSSSLQSCFQQRPPFHTFPKGYPSFPSTLCFQKVLALVLCNGSWHRWQHQYHHDARPSFTTSYTSVSGWPLVF